MKIKTLSYFSSALLVIVSLGASAQAASISGTIDFAGPVTLNGTIGSATEVTTFTAPRVSNASGDFDTFVTSQNEGPLFIGDLATIASPWSFNSGSVVPFWQVGGFTFDLTSSAILQQNSGFLDVRGTGIVSGNGFSNTDGIWQFNMTNAGSSSFSFQSSTAAVPDNGTTALLLGVSLFGLHGLRRKFSNC
jgi:hypothetical protein